MRLSSSARSAVFAPLEATGRAETITRRLSDALALGLLRDGEQLPSEVELAERFEVAVVTVREALGELRSDGLVVTRRGRGGGSFVQTGASAPLAVLRARAARLGLVGLRDLADHYAAIACAAAELAASRADLDDHDRLDELAGMLAEQPNVGGRRRCEAQFHLELAAAAQSPRLTRAELDLQPEIGPVLWLVHADSEVASTAGQRHRQISAAIRSGDPPGARAATSDHIRDLVVATRQLIGG